MIVLTMLRSGVVLVFAGIILCGSAAVYSQSVTGKIGDGSVTRGRAATAMVTLDIPSELHTNSNQPSKPELIPTTIKVTAKDFAVSAIKYPAGHDRKFEYDDKPLNVYEGKVNFTFQLTVPSSYRNKEISVDVDVRYQACTDEVCYPPKTKTITLTAAIK
jgi:thiol:disulfide interchange protein